jgi:hypothetical protein
MAPTDFGVGSQTGSVAFGARRPLTIPVWLTVPLLFATAVLGLTGLGGVLLDAGWRVTLSSALFGPAAAVTAVLALGLEWKARWQRLWIGVGYPLLVFSCGLVFNDVSLPPALAMVTGVPALVILVVVVARDRNKVVPIA